jgi:hypothetical protein
MSDTHFIADTESELKVRKAPYDAIPSRARNLSDSFQPFFSSAA